MKVIYYKIWRDLWNNKARTLQVVFVIAIGAFAIGLVLGARNLISEAFATSWQATSPSMIKLAVDPPLSDDELLTLKKIKGVSEVEGQMSASIQWRLRPDEPWQVGFLSARDSYTEQKMNTVELVSPQWPSSSQFV